MTDMLPFVVLGLLLATGLLLALAGYALRGFSRKRLDELCRTRGNEERFGVILRQHDSALQVVEFWLVLITGGFAALTFRLWDLSEPVTYDAAGWALYLVKVAALLFLLLMGLAILPWSLSRVAGERYLYRVWPLLAVLQTVSRPTLSIAAVVDTFLHRMAGIREPENGDTSVLTEEISTVLDEGQREGVLESKARTMIHRVMELQQEDTAAVMTPRTDMVCIPAEASLDEARNTMLEAGHSRVPVIGETTDDIVGILYAKDLLQYLDASNGRAAPLRDIVREPLYVPETTSIDKLLERLNRERVHMAIVIDEYSGVSGLVTMEDVLEEIVGEIVDEYDPAEEDGIHEVSPGVVEVEGRVHIDDLNEQFELGLPEDKDFDTIGGFVFNELGRVPKPNDTFTWDQVRVTILDVDERKIHKLRLESTETASAASGQMQAGGL